MKLFELFSDHPGVNKLFGPLRDHQISAIVFDSRQARRDCVFVAVRGGASDGHQFISKAIEAGAVGLVVEDRQSVPPEFGGFVLQVASTREALAQLSAKFFGDPSARLFTVGVTGTNGKTTSTHMIESLLGFGGKQTGVIGTIDHHLGAKVWSTGMTTPDPVSFQSRLKDFVEAGASAVALEVSSHALDQRRVDGVEFDVGIFTNLTRDHLDYHGTMESYFRAKQRFFFELLERSSKPHPTAILNADDEWIAKGFLAENLVGRVGSKVRYWTFGRLGGPADLANANLNLRYSVVRESFTGVEFDLELNLNLENGPVNESRRLIIPMPGAHNVQNALGALGAALAAGMKLNEVATALAKMPGVRGRLESVVNDRGIHVFVDYAHSDDSLGAVLALLGRIRAENAASAKSCRIITVFGCGGDRDRGKRPLMMAAALKGSESVVLTSDNPRTEDPERILDDALRGLAGKPDPNRVHRVVDRKAAIRTALELAQPGDVVLIAGKGHENYQIIGAQKIEFSDVKVAAEILRTL